MKRNDFFWATGGILTTLARKEFHISDRSISVPSSRNTMTVMCAPTFRECLNEFRRAKCLGIPHGNKGRTDAEDTWSIRIPGIVICIHVSSDLDQNGEDSNNLWQRIDWTMTEQTSRRIVRIASRIRLRSFSIAVGIVSVRHSTVVRRIRQKTGNLSHNSSRGPLRRAWLFQPTVLQAAPWCHA